MYNMRRILTHEQIFPAERQPSSDESDQQIAAGQHVMTCFVSVDLPTLQTWLLPAGMPDTNNKILT